jgi:hypothetical protein
VKLIKSKRRVVLAVGAVLLALFIVRPGANGLRKRIVSSVGMALGRHVEVQWVKLRILPQPGFDLENFIVYDDPRFGAEPMLRAQEVTATLRLRSLIRGRLEIGRLNLKEPSFNLVRGEDGHWNIEALLDRAAHIPSAPTSHVRPERRPVFPYIQADNGRINFKIGQEKKSYALTEADFALWLDSENEWGMRLAAKPVRTDFNLSDTGALRVAGTWRRSGSLRETPVKFSLDWEQAQLGQFTKLLSGKDKGWRGGVTLSSTLSGTPADLTLSLRATLADFRRYDIVSSDSLRLAAACSAHYSSIEHALSNLVCQAPMERGALILAGEIKSPTGPRSYDLELLAQDVPVKPLASLLRHIKKDVPDDLSAAGLLNGTMTMRTTADHGRLMCLGGGLIENLRLASGTTKGTLTADKIPFVFSSGDVHLATARVNRGASVPDGTQVNLGPATFSLGGSSTANVSGRVDSSAYSLVVQGESQVPRILAAGRMIGFRTPEINTDGTANLHLEIAGQWAEFASPNVSGTAQLHSLHPEVPGVGPIEIRSANLILANDSVQLQSVSAIAAGSRWSGTVQLPRACAGTQCRAQFDVQADTVFVDRLNSWLHPQARNGPWYRVLSPRQQGPSLLKSINAAGKISAGRVVFRKLEAHEVSGKLQLGDGKILLEEIAGDTLSGKHVGNWQADLGVTPPTYSGTGRFEHVSMSDLAEAMHDGWITGTGHGTYRFTASGSNAKDAINKASAILDFDVQNGVLSHITLAGSSAPLRLRHFAGQLLLNNGEFKLEKSKLDTGEGSYQVSGNATMAQKVNLKLLRGTSQGYNITGTLSVPRVVPVSSTETQAALKP